MPFIFIGQALDVLSVGLLYGWDANDNRIHQQYDLLRRPSQRIYTSANGSTTKVLEQWTYGEGQTSDKNLNLRGVVFRIHDGAGRVVMNSYDFKGLPLSSTRTYTTNEQLHPNWGGTVALEATSYTTSQTYDALGRTKTQTTPDGGMSTFTYERSGQLYSVVLTNVRGLNTTAVSSISYNAGANQGGNA